MHSNSPQTNQHSKQLVKSLLIYPLQNPINLIIFTPAKVIKTAIIKQALPMRLFSTVVTEFRIVKLAKATLLTFPRRVN